LRCRLTDIKVDSSSWTWLWSSQALLETGHGGLHLGSTQWNETFYRLLIEFFVKTLDVLRTTILTASIDDV
jgi:hypothetical protein